jgi:hypothetical protein
MDPALEKGNKRDAIDQVNAAAVVSKVSGQRQRLQG